MNYWELDIGWELDQPYLREHMNRMNEQSTFFKQGANRMQSLLTLSRQGLQRQHGGATLALHRGSKGTAKLRLSITRQLVEDAGLAQVPCDLIWDPQTGNITIQQDQSGIPWKLERCRAIIVLTWPLGTVFPLFFEAVDCPITRVGNNLLLTPPPSVYGNLELLDPPPEM